LADAITIHCSHELRAMNPPVKYTCAEYRQEMMLLGLMRRLEAPGLPDAEREVIAEKIRRLKQQMGMD
jgi:hypothetical protein